MIFNNLILRQYSAMGKQVRISILVLSTCCCSSFCSLLPLTRDMYNSMSRLMGETQYPESWWQERAECFEQLSPELAGTMEKAWEGMVEYWSTRGKEGDTWRSCPEKSSWFESNCSSQPGVVAMDIWEPCNFASNLAYDRLIDSRC